MKDVFLKSTISMIAGGLFLVISSVGLCNEFKMPSEGWGMNTSLGSNRQSG